MTHAIRLGSIALSAIALIAGCNNQHSVGTTYFKGYLSTDTCSSLGSQNDCLAKAGCDWIAPKCPSGMTCPAGVCYEPNACATITDPTKCSQDPSCAWSSAQKLCPVGVSCPNGGFCHPSDPSGCACVTPIACPNGVPCPPPECDCTGGGSGGGTCTCADPGCQPGQFCPPSKCDCGPNGGGGSGCVNGGTCVCNCPLCPAGTTCPACDCGCGSGGTVPSPMPGANTPNPCGSLKDATACMADTDDKCEWFGIAMPCNDPSGKTCVSGICQGPMGSSGGTGGGCACACPGCDPSTQNCPPCACDCGPGNPGCVPPSMPPNPTPCPAIACNPQPTCPHGVTTDPMGCPTCTCA